MTSAADDRLAMSVPGVSVRRVPFAVGLVISDLRSPTSDRRLHVSMAAHRHGYHLIDTLELDDHDQAAVRQACAELQRCATVTDVQALLICGGGDAILEAVDARADELRMRVHRL